MNRLREIREKLGVSKWRLAHEADLNWKTIHRVENENKAAFERTKEKIAKALGMNVEEIFPSGEVKHIFIVEPRKIGLEKKKSYPLSSDVIGFLLDRKLRRCSGVVVNLMAGRLKLAISTSEEDGRFEFKNVPAGEYIISSRKIRIEISV